MDEHYNNLTLKTLFTLKYFLNSSNFVTPPKYLVKVDDDTFVNVPRLWNTLNYDENSTLQTIFSTRMQTEESKERTRHKLRIMLTCSSDQ